MATITILEGNYNSVAEAQAFKKFILSKGHNVDYRENTSGNTPNYGGDHDLSNELWDEFCRS